MQKIHNTEALEEGFVLLDAIITIIIISLFLLAAAGFFSTAVSRVTHLENSVLEGLEESFEHIESMEILFDGE